MGKLKSVCRLLRVNWQTMAGFQILYKLLSYMLFTPLFRGIFQWIMKATGYEYLTIDNIVPFLLNPVTIIMLMVLLLIMTAYTMVDIGAVVYLLDQSFQGIKVNLAQMFCFAVVNAMKVFRGKNIILAFVVLFLIPFLNIGAASCYVGSISVPEFILDYMKNSAPLMILSAVVLVILGRLLLRWLYAFHYFTLEGCDYAQARKKSAQMSRGNRRKDLIVLLGTQLLLSVLFICAVLAGIFVAVLPGRIFSGTGLISIIPASVVWVFLAVAFHIMWAFATPVSYACISLMYYGHKKERQEEIVHVKAPCPVRRKMSRNVIRIAAGVFLTVSVACCSYYLYGVCHHKFSIQIEYVRTMEVTAHRGASARCPENTMAAFKEAARLGADWIELDVRQCGDGQIVVVHDENLKRVAGVDKNIREMDYGEISRLDAGSYFAPEFAGERIPSLSGVIDFAKKKGIQLNIELKPSGHEQNFEQCVVDLIRAENFEENCVVTSISYETLERVKAYDQDIQTVYVMSLAYGDITKLAAADHFSIEASSISREMVADIHYAGKRVYAWTPNTQESISRMIELGVDNIVTDDVTLAKECIYISRTSDVVTEYVKWLQSI